MHRDNFSVARRPRVVRTSLLLAALSVLSLGLSGCDSFDFYGLLSGATPGPTGAALAISPVSVTVTVGETCAFSASGGTPPYTYSLVSGSGAIDPTTGVYTAPAAPSSDAIEVTDAAGDTAQARAVAVQQ